MASYGYYPSSAPSSAPALAPPVTAALSSGPSTNGTQERITRILVVGETRVGKTLLIRRLCDHVFGDTSIESTTEDYTAFCSSAKAETANDEDDLGPEGGPTGGIAIDALKRTTTVLCSRVSAPPARDLTMQSMYTPAPGSSAPTPSSSGVYMPDGSGSGYPGYPAPPAPYPGAPQQGGSSMQYRGAAAAANAYNNGLDGSWANAPTNAYAPQPFHAAPVQQRCNVMQTVEFHELGGTHGYRDIARLPLQSMQYDGVIFVYHRRNLTSTVYLKEWYHWVRNVLSRSAGVSSSSSGRAKSMPRFMLVGTQLEGDELTAAAAGVRKEVDATLHIGTTAVSDEALLDGNFAVRVRTLQSPQTPKPSGRAKRAVVKVGRSLAWPYHMLWGLWHPFFFLTEQYQEERGPRNKLVTLCTRLVERLVWLVYKLDQTLQYLMAVILFGPYQEAVVLGHKRTKQTLEELRKDEQCVAQAHVCRLDSDIALQSSLDELVAFFDILLRES